MHAYISGLCNNCSICGLRHFHTHVTNRRVLRRAKCRRRMDHFQSPVANTAEELDKRLLLLATRITVDCVFVLSYEELGHVLAAATEQGFGLVSPISTDISILALDAQRVVHMVWMGGMHRKDLFPEHTSEFKCFVFWTFNGPKQVWPKCVRAKKLLTVWNYARPKALTHASFSTVWRALLRQKSVKLSCRCTNRGLRYPRCCLRGAASSTATRSTARRPDGVFKCLLPLTRPLKWRKRPDQTPGLLKMMKTAMPAFSSPKLQPGSQLSKIHGPSQHQSHSGSSSVQLKSMRKRLKHSWMKA